MSVGYEGRRRCARAGSSCRSRAFVPQQILRATAYRPDRQWRRQPPSPQVCWDGGDLVCFYGIFFHLHITHPFSSATAFSHTAYTVLTTNPGVLGRRRPGVLRQLPLRIPPRVRRLNRRGHGKGQALDVPAPRVLRVRAQHGQGRRHAAAMRGARPRGRARGAARARSCARACACRRATVSTEWQAVIIAVPHPPMRTHSRTHF